MLECFLLFLFSFLQISLVFENISRLAVQCLTDCLQRGKPDRADLSSFDLG